MARRKAQPSQRQVTALKLIQQGVSPTQAMLKAGYSKATSRNPTPNLLNRASFLGLMEQTKVEMGHLGINSKYLAMKFKEFMEAEKDTTKDYNLQLRAVEVLLKADNQGKGEEKGLRRKLTVEEYLND